MQYWRIWHDDAGESHMEQVPVEWQREASYAAGVPPVDVARWLGSGGESHFSRLSLGWFGDWHPAPGRQFVVLLQGALEVTVSDGTRMTGGPGTVWLVEDTRGKGHQTRAVGSEDAVRISVLLD